MDMNPNLSSALAIPSLLMLLALPAAVQAQSTNVFGYAIHDGTITINNYISPGSDVSIPSMINGLPVTGIGGREIGINEGFFGAFEGSSLTAVVIPDSVTNIGEAAFYNCTSLTNVTIPDSVTSIGEETFRNCTSLANLTIPHSVTSIGNRAFYGCTSLTNVTIPNSVTNIGGETFRDCTRLSNVRIPDSLTSISPDTFAGCTSLTSVTIPDSVTNIEDGAFYGCTRLRRTYFQGNAPNLLGPSVFSGGTPVTVYHLPGTTGWVLRYGGRPIKLWSLPNPAVLTTGSSFGIQTNQFGFTISWATNLSVVVEATADLAHPAWAPVSTNTLTSGASYFSDPQRTTSPSRFYRLRSQ